METGQKLESADEGAVNATGRTPATAAALETPRHAELSLERFAAMLGERANARTIFGEPVHGEEVTVIPAARVVWAVGGGGGEGMPAAETTGEERPRRAARQGSGSGGGGGVVVSPVGYIVLRRGDAEFRPITPVRRLLAAAAAGVMIGGWLARRGRRRAAFA